MENCKINAARETIASQFLSTLKAVAEKADAIAERTQGKLSALQIPTPEKETADTGKPMESWPPFFAECKRAAFQIQNALDRIEGSVNKAEI
jgi:hypothetical protein